MDKIQVLNKVIQENNGYLQTKQAVEAGITKPTLANFVEQHSMKKVARGIYLAEGAWEDQLYQLSLANKRIVFSHESALYLHGLMEREPKNVTVTVPQEYNASHLRGKKVKVYRARLIDYNLGQEEVDTPFGNRVRSYDMDRTICDIIKKKEKMDIQVFQYAIREYMKRANKNTNNLLKYAKQLKIEAKVRTYTEVLL